MSASDTGGSGIVWYRVYVSTSTDAPGFANWSIPTIWINSVPGGVSVTTTYSSLVSGTAYRFYVVAIDGAGNETNPPSPTPPIAPFTGFSGIYKFDNTPPVVSSISSNTNGNLIANTNQSFVITGGSDCGSPLIITATLQGAGWVPTSVTATPSATCPYTYSFVRDISVIDPYRGANGWRQWDYVITQICDQAGNCVPSWLPKTFSYTAYADATNANIAAWATNANITNGSAVADGSQNIFTQTIRDQFGNAIVPATGINRTISMNLSSITNSMYLNQYDRSGGSSVFVDTNTTTLLQSVWPQSLGSRASSDGSYPLSLFVYTPTWNIGTPSSDSSATFWFTSNLVVTDTLWVNKTFPQSLSGPSFKPLYTSQISGNLRDGGFIEWANQASLISISQSSSPSVSNAYLQLEFSWANAANFTLQSIPPNSIIGTRSTIGWITTTNISSFLRQNSGLTIATTSNLQFSTHFSYILDGKQIVYNGDLIGKSGWYWGNIVTWLGNQVWLKVIGPIASNIVQAIVDGQFASSTSIFGGISRSEVRNKMRQSIALATRNITLRSTPDSLTDLSTISATNGNAQGAVIDKWDGSSIIRLEKTGGKVTLEATTISGRRTLVIRGADLYIHGNMSYADTSSILGIVIQKDEAGNGGNLYIDPSVTNIVGTYIIDGSVSSSSDGLSMIGVGDISTLKNQLYIYGSIVSENTIWGSRMFPVKCPTQISGSCGSAAEAQKYDLNYLRRYYLVPSTGLPFGNGQVIGGGTCTTTSCSGFTSGLKQKFFVPTEDLAQYPVIIEYNPLIRTTPPVGFEQTRE
jgi:hypothetical protein